MPTAVLQPTAGERDIRRGSRSRLLSTPVPPAPTPLALLAVAKGEVKAPCFECQANFKNRPANSRVVGLPDIYRASTRQASLPIRFPDSDRKAALNRWVGWCHHSHMASLPGLNRLPYNGDVIDIRRAAL
jgi:hypothetical protein